MVTPAPPRRPTQRGLVERFEEQARLRGAHLAVAETATGTAWIYEELDARANRIANAILERLGDAEEPVPVLMPTSAQAIAALLGVLKAGKTWAPVDPRDPEERILGRLRRLRTRLIVTDRAHLGLASTLAARLSGTLEAELSGRAVRAIPTDEIERDASLDPPAVEVDPDRPARILWHAEGERDEERISSQGEVFEAIEADRRALTLTHHDRVALVSSLAEPGAAVTALHTLLRGAVLFPMTPEDGGKETLATWIQERGITVWHSDPAHLALLPDTVDPAAPPGPRRPRTFAGLRAVRVEGASLPHAVERRPAPAPSPLGPSSGLRRKVFI